jgi:amino acid permease
MGGYLYALDDTTDNILVNFPVSDPAILLGRMGFCFTLLFALPLVTLPCREAIRAIPSQIRYWIIDSDLANQFEEVDAKRKQGAHLIINGVDFDENMPLLATDDPEMRHGTMVTYGPPSPEKMIAPNLPDHDTLSSTADDTDNSASQQAWNNREEDPQHNRTETIIQFGTTFGIVAVCYVAAITVPGVAFVWSICGSSMGMMIAFIIPTACYLKIRTHKRFNRRTFVSWALLIVSCLAAIVCTKQAIFNV